MVGFTTVDCVFQHIRPKEVNLYEDLFSELKKACEKDIPLLEVLLMKLVKKQRVTPIY